MLIAKKGFEDIFAQVKAKAEALSAKKAQAHKEAAAAVEADFCEYEKQLAVLFAQVSEEAPDPTPAPEAPVIPGPIPVINEPVPAVVSENAANTLINE